MAGTRMEIKWYKKGLTEFTRIKNQKVRLKGKTKSEFSDT